MKDPQHGPLRVNNQLQIHHDYYISIYIPSIKSQDLEGVTNLIQSSGLADYFKLDLAYLNDPLLNIIFFSDHQMKRFC